MDRLQRGLRPQDHEAHEGAGAHDENGREQRCPLEGEAEQHDRDRDEPERGRTRDKDDGGTHRAQAILSAVPQLDYSSGEDYIVEFLGYQFGFNGPDFEERVTAAAVKLGLIPDNDLDEDETADLVELASDGQIADPRSGLGRYLMRHWEQISLARGESLVYWLRKLVFRGAWLDHRVKEGLLEVSWDEERADFGYREPGGDRALLELAPVPSWHQVQFKP